MKRAAIIASFLFALAGSAHAQTLEEQLRSQLADARSQLQDLQGQQAQWQAEKTKLEQERDAANKEAAAAKAELGKDRSATTQDTSALSAERTAREQAEAQAQSLQKALAESNAKEHTQAQHDTDLATQLNEAQTQVTTCTARNQQLYKIGNEILDAYSHMTVGRVIASREPFAASERVKLDNAAQAYGDQLYQQRYDPRMAPSKKP
jgi:chromosome segregation ATPase